ncbi:hypothetical protein [Chitinimonas sp.]|uniref:hypothetical protein n=1 Tax=Chitinimonas sp. TaxID=1934313 RepID=UPI002F9363AC
MKREVAQQIEPVLREAFSLVNKTTAISKEQDSEEAFVEYRGEAAQVMGQMFFLMEKLYKEFPDLMPESFKD